MERVSIPDLQGTKPCKVGGTRERNEPRSDAENTAPRPSAARAFGIIISPTIAKFGMAASPEPLEDLRLTTERNAKSPGARGLGRRTEIRAAAIVGEPSLLHERRKQNKTPQTLSSHGTLVEQPFPKELLIFSLTDCAWRIVRTHSRLRSVILGKAGATNVSLIAQTPNF